MERESNLLGPHTSQGSEARSVWLQSAPTPGHRCPALWAIAFLSGFSFAFPRFLLFTCGKCLLDWVSQIPRVLRKGEPRTPGHQIKGQPQRKSKGEGRTSGGPVRLYLQEEAHLVTRRFKYCAALSYYISGHHWASFQSVPLGIQPNEQFQEGSLLVSCRSGTVLGVWDGSITAGAEGAGRLALCPAEICPSFPSLDLQGPQS